MKIVLTANGHDLNASLDSRFGRAANFLVYDTEDGSFSVLDNQQNLNAAQGAGIQAAQAVVASGAEILLTGHCGPKAFRVLQAAGVRTYTTGAATVTAALEEFKAGKLAEIQSADVEGHWV